jgi:hypothetical protein
MCYIDGQKNKYSVLNECSRMLKYDMFESLYKFIQRTCVVLETVMM